MAENYRRNFKKAENLYMKENYEVLLFCSSRYSDKNVNAVSRIVNSFMAAINSKVYLPSFIMVILDDDLIQFMQYKKYGVSTLYGTWIEYLAKLFVEIVDKKCSQLPASAQLEDKTQIYWVEPAAHSNFVSENRQMREKFTVCLDCFKAV